MNDTAPIRLLLVDDESSLREPLAEYLSRQGFVVSQAASAAEARSRLRDGDPDLVLLDIMMPGKTGLEVCQHVRAVERLRQVVIVMLTAKGRETDVAKGLALGANAYVTKPFSTRDLVAQVRALLQVKP